VQNNLSSTSENETCKQALERMNFLQHCLNYKGSSKSVEELSFHFMTESPATGTDRSINQLRSYLPKMTPYFMSYKRTTGSKGAFKYHAKKLHISQRIQRRKRLNVKKIYLGGREVGWIEG